MGKCVFKSTMPSLWRPKIDCQYYPGEMKKKFKNHIVIKLYGYGDFKVPYNAVEIYSIINKPANDVWLEKNVNPILKRFSKYGFKRLSDDSLKIILAWQYFLRKRTEYALLLALKIERKKMSRGDIIRELRSKFRFRDTKENRSEYAQADVYE